jgi:hypothetical protein
MGKSSHKKKRRRNDSPTVVPLSESLIKLAHSICQNPNSFSFEQMKNIISIAAIAWNLSLIPKESRAQHVQACMAGPLLNSLKSEMAAKQNDKEFHPTLEKLNLISIMLRKKDEMYPDDKRVIVNYKVTSLGNGEYNVTVASADTADEPDGAET